MPRLNLNDVDWNFIKQSIKNEKCVLCLGTETYRGANASLYHEFVASTAEKFKQDSELYPQEDLLFFKEPNIKTRAYSHLASLYQETPVASQPMLEKLAKIEFHLIINLSPDTFLKQIFEKFAEQGLEAQFDYYSIGQPVADIKAPTSEKPLLYNLFGSVEQSKSLVFTHEDIFEYIFSILRTHEIHDNLKNAIQEAECFLFIGGQLDHWYIKILLQLLKFLTRNAVKYATPLKEPANERFYYQMARIEFIDNQTEWVDRLYAECEKEGVLRKLGTEAKVSRKKELLDLLDQIDYPAFFAKIDELKIESMDMSTFKMAFIKGRIDLNFEERLRVYVQSLDI